MSQADFVISNQPGNTFRTELTNSLQALASMSSGATAPTSTYPYQLWQDTSASPAVLKIRNGANTAWVTLGVWGDSFFSLFTNGTERMRILSDGKVGINKTAPAYQLDVNGEINATGLRIAGVAINAGAGNRIRDDFTGTGSTTTFTLSSTPASINNTEVFVSGVYQLKGIDYTLSGSIITFTSAPPNLAKIQVLTGATATIGVPSDASVGTTQLADGGVTNAKLAASAVTLAKMGGDVTAAGKALLDDADAAAQRTTLGLTDAAIASYASGTWTPVIKGSSTAGSGTYTGNTFGKYQRIGNIVYFTARIEYSGHTGTGNLLIDGLPITAANNAIIPIISVGLTYPTSTSQPNGIVRASSTIIDVYSGTQGGPTVLYALAMDAAADIQITGFYFV